MRVHTTRYTIGTLNANVCKQGGRPRNPPTRNDSSTKRHNLYSRRCLFTLPRMTCRICAQCILRENRIKLPTASGCRQQSVTQVTNMYTKIKTTYTNVRGRSSDGKVGLKYPNPNRYKPRVITRLSPERGRRFHPYGSTSSPTPSPFCRCGCRDLSSTVHPASILI